MHLTGIGFGGLGMSDADTLYPGNIVTFEVTGSPCSGISASDISTTLQNWTGQMMKINTIGNTASGYIPGVVDVQVNATVLREMPAGDLRGQIMQALAAMQPSQTESTIGLMVGAVAPGAGIIGQCPGGIGLKDSVINLASGGTNNAPNPPAYNPFGSLELLSGGAALGIAAAGILALILLTRK